jgi:hypothetical protein
MFAEKTYFVVIADKKKNDFGFAPLKKDPQSKVRPKFQQARGTTNIPGQPAGF